MADYERYGDYNEIDADPGKKTKLVLNLMKISVLLVCLAVVGVLGFRMVAFNSYPESISKLYFDDVLTSYYNNTEGNIGAKTQKLRYPYDDENLGNFFCDYMVIIDGADQLQVALKYNKSTIKRINNVISAENAKRKEKGLSEFSLLSDTDENLFTFRLTDGLGHYFEGESVAYESKFMYRYQKLVFNGVELPLEDGSYPEGLMVEISLNLESEVLKPLKDVHFLTLEDKVENSIPKDPNADIFANGKFLVLVYENKTTYNTFSDYELSKGEAPSND